ncbi:MAG: hypothetical protein P5678_22350 [Limnospira sp. PMC 1240.20]|nr:hypothetical protein [Limnospira sp. PMC 1245.20]MDT9221275.1 hypothetical protein [Limnospira sp. PMC 1240.20]MDT9256927.1 hypothetical protein [Limnospira sp. PMC 1254.20]MDT9267068.1 hypothetical protein [Limnospira sp. PMC 1223.20]MDT9318250.1 hypothetical protein [Limnospira sp. PMC 1306.21]MDT9323294.1 hypothetical protein [Limnospira sp. PMC 1290.21]
MVGLLYLYVYPLLPNFLWEPVIRGINDYYQRSQPQNPVIATIIG